MRVKLSTETKGDKMTTHALLFSKDLAERAHLKFKTVTRRIAKDCPKLCPHTGNIIIHNPKQHCDPSTWITITPEEYCQNNVKYKVGDILVVKETYWEWGCKHPTYSKNGRKSWNLMTGLEREEVKPILWEEPAEAALLPGDTGYHKRSSMFMPWIIARTRGRLKSVTAELLQDITDDECIREGIKRLRSMHAPFDAVKAFRGLWERINGLDGPKSWLANPVVIRLEWDPMNEYECLTCSKKFWGTKGACWCSDDCENGYAKSLES